MKLHELYKRIDPKTDMLNSALAALHRRASSKGDLQSIDGYAFDIIRSYNIDIGAKELARLYREKHNIAEDEESVNEGYKLQLERDTDMMVLHIKDTATGKRTEVRGKPGYETNYDPNDSLHILLDKVGKSANISELMNGEVVTINPKHPDGASAKKATTKAFNEEVEVSLHGDAKKGYVLSKIEVSGNERNAGQGTKAMQDIVDRMDREGAVIALTPDDAYGGNKNRLIKFYKRFGFVPNKGRNKDFRFRETMIRYPQSNESITEAFDNPYKFKVTENNNNRWQAQALTDNNIIISFLATNVDTINGVNETGWGIDFKTANADTPNDTTYDLTGKGDGQRTMTTVLAMLKKFIQDHSPKEIYFDAAKNDGNSRTNLYQRIIQRFAGGLGYTVDVQDAGNRDDFTLVKKVQEATVTEALDNPYPFKLSGPSDSQGFVATAQTPNGMLRMDIESTDYDNFGIDFAVGKSMGKTGAGDEFRVFATVVAMMYKWISTVGIEHVESFDFGANKGEHASDGRAKLYTRFAKKLASQLGWRLEQTTTQDGSTAFFKLTNPKPVPREQEYWDALEENFADGKVKGKSRPGRVKKSGASCNGSVTALRKRAKNASGEKAKMLRWCANMKSGRQKK